MDKIIIDLQTIDRNISSLDLLSSQSFFLFIKQFFNNTNLRKIPTHLFEPNPTSFVAFTNKVILKDKQTFNQLNSMSDKEKEPIINFIGQIYDFWRKHERYLIMIQSGKSKISHRAFLKAFGMISSITSDAYRDLCEAIIGKEFTVYRVIPSGCNAGLLLKREELNLPLSLSFLNECPIMENVITQPPFIITSEENTRKGFFFEKNKKIRKENFDTNNSYGVLIDVYNTKGVVYFEKKYLGFLVSLGNLFHMESYDSEKKDKIDFVILFGTKDTGNQCYYYKEDFTFVGVCPIDGKIDYFGYAKKMVLTLFNLIMIERKLLPIHGAGVEISDGVKSKNFFLLGDSGAGKSETLEAIKRLFNNKYIINTIFDDMGTFHLINNKIYATGTEIGAFVRLDDLDQAYSLESADRAVFLNIDKENSRVVIPIEDYETTYTLHKVDAFLLADNYTDCKDGICFYKNYKKALADFIEGKRMAMRTTSEKGLVSTFFANPFGPLQNEKVVRGLLPLYFKALFNNKVPVGKVFTRLSIDKKKGPESGAKALISLFNKTQN